MTKLTILIICVCFAELIYGRPADLGSENEGDTDEMEYEETKDIADPGEEQDSRVKPKEMYQYKPSKKNGMEDNNAKTNDYDSIGYMRDLPKYSINEDTEAQRAPNNFMQSQLHSNMLSANPSEKKPNDMKINEDGETLFEYKKDEPGKIDKGEFNQEPLVMNADYSKQFLNQIRLQNRPLIENRHGDFAHLYLSRDRRETESKDTQAKQGNPVTKESEDTPKENIVKVKEDDEQMAIKRHLKKLTDDEIQELLNSLSEEKRALLKKIISDDVTDTDGINKREITKKAQAVEGNSFSESADFSKIESVTVAEMSAANAETTENSKQGETKPENMENVSAKSAENTQNTALQKQVENLEKKSDSSVTSNDPKTYDKSEIVPNNPATVKTESKREVNTGEYAEVSYEDPKVDDVNVQSKDDQSKEGYRCPDESNQFADDEKVENADGTHISKRDADVQQQDFDSKIKSLEESFPSSDAYDESPGPLIRVKRKNAESVIKKRSAGVMPDAKVAYLSYKSENDEDADEGNEFDDDGFYDRTPNFCNENRNIINDNSKLRQIKKIGDSKTGANFNEVNKDTNSLGTDSDSVLSGVEAVDENLMFNSNSRNRRTVNDNSEDADALQSIDSKSVSEENKENSENNARNDPNYQENDAFGALPHSYAGDLGRYKRIRRVKQSHTDETQINT